MPIPASFTPLDPEVAKRLLEGQEDVLTGEMNKLDAFYRQFDCPRCKGQMMKHWVNTRFAYAEGYIPRFALKCQNCDCVFDPHNGILLEMGNLGKAQSPVDIPIIDPSRYSSSG